MAIPWSEIRAGVELVILVALAIKAFGSSLQKSEDVNAAHSVRLAEQQAKLDALDTRVQSLREIRIADRLSRLESAVHNFEKWALKQFVPRELCDERTASAEKDRHVTRAGPL